MQAGGPLDLETAERAEKLWTECGLSVLEIAEKLDALGLHKQVANRILEPWDHITVVLSTTKINNHFKLRLETDPVTGRPMADPTYYELAQKWKAAYDASVPFPLQQGQWHLPYVSKDSQDSSGNLLRMWYGEEVHLGVIPLETLKKISVGRCARVSYLRQGQGDIEENVKLHDRLSVGGHWSPFEHVATPIPDIFFCKAAEATQRACAWCGGVPFGPMALVRSSTVCGKCSYGHIHSGNFHGWAQYRKEFSGETGGD